MGLTPHPPSQTAAYNPRSSHGRVYCHPPCSRQLLLLHHRYLRVCSSSLNKIPMSLYRNERGASKYRPTCAGCWGGSKWSHWHGLLPDVHAAGVPHRRHPSGRWCVPKPKPASKGVDLDLCHIWVNAIVTVLTGDQGTVWLPSKAILCWRYPYSFDKALRLRCRHWNPVQLARVDGPCRCRCSASHLPRQLNDVHIRRLGTRPCLSCPE